MPDVASVLLDVTPNGSGVVVTVRLVGEVDLASVAELEGRLETVLAEPSGRTIVIDLEALEFLGVCGVTALLTACRCAEDAGREVRVINAQGAPARALRLLGLESWCERVAARDGQAADEPH